MEEQIEVNESQIVNYEFYKEICDDISCLICLKLLEDPLMCGNCEGNFCKKCINDWRQRSNICPNNCKPLNLKEVSLSQKKLLNKITINCPNGCKISLYDYYKHIVPCMLKNQEIPCWVCQNKVKKENMKLSEDDYNKLIEEFDDLRLELQKLPKIQSELDNAKDREITYLREIESHKAENERLKQLAGKYLSEISSLSDELISSQNYAETLSANILKIKEEHASFQKENKELKESYNAFISNKEKFEKERDLFLMDYQSKLQSRDKTIKELRDEITKSDKMMNFLHMDHKVIDIEDEDIHDIPDEKQAGDLEIKLSSKHEESNDLLLKFKICYTQDAKLMTVINYKNTDYLACYVNMDNSILLFQLGDELKQINQITETSPVYCICSFKYKSRDEEERDYLATGNEEKVIKIWDQFNTNNLMLIIENNDLMNCLVSFKQNTSYVVASGNHEGTIKIWNPYGSNLCLNGHIADVFCIVEFKLNNGQYLASGGLDKSIILWSLAQTKKVSVLVGHEYPVTCLMTYSHRGKEILVSGDHDGYIYLWDIASRTKLTILNEEVKSRAIFCLIPIKIEDITFIVSAGRDKTIIVYDTYSFRVNQIIQNLHTKHILGLVTFKSGNEDYLISGSVDKKLNVLKIRPKITI